MDHLKAAQFYLENSNRDLRNLMGKVKELQYLNQTVLAHIDAQTRNYCQVANLTAGRLILLVANGSIATQLRFQTAGLMAQFKRDPLLARIQSIQCKVSPAMSSSTSTTVSQSRRMDKLSEDTAEIVHAIAQSIKDDELRKVMERIAGRR